VSEHDRNRPGIGVDLRNMSILVGGSFTVVAYFFPDISIHWKAVYTGLVAIFVVFLVLLVAWLADQWEKRQRRQQYEASKLPSSIVSENYLKQMDTSWLSLGVGICLFGVVAIIMNDLVTGAIVLILGSSTVGHHLLTKFRVERGYFGTNSVEALELIEFIRKYVAGTGAPPGSRVSREYDARERASVVEPFSGQVRTP